METQKRPFGKGRRKVEIKKIEKYKSLLVTFSKRRTGLFKKAREFSALYGVDIALLVRSPTGKIYSFSNQSVESLIDRYVAQNSSSQNSNIPYNDQRQEHQPNDEMGFENMGKIESGKLNGETSMGLGENMGLYLNILRQPIGDLGLNEMIQYKSFLQVLEKNVMNSFEKLVKANSSFLDGTSETATWQDLGSFGRVENDGNVSVSDIYIPSPIDDSNGSFRNGNQGFDDTWLFDDLEPLFGD